MILTKVTEHRDITNALPFFLFNCSCISSNILSKHSLSLSCGTEDEDLLATSRPNSPDDDAQGLPHNLREYYQQGGQPRVGINLHESASSRSRDQPSTTRRCRTDNLDCEDVHLLRRSSSLCTCEDRCSPTSRSYAPASGSYSQKESMNSFDDEEVPLSRSCSLDVAMAELPPRNVPRLGQSTRLIPTMHSFPLQ